VGFKVVHDECALEERVVVHLQPGSVSNYLQDEAAEHTNEKAPCAIPYPENYLKEKRNGEYSNVEAISTEIWFVKNLALLQGARCNGATVE